MAFKKNPEYAFDYAVDTFLAEKNGKNGFAHKNRFAMMLNFPPGISDSNPRTLNLMIDATTLPGQRILSREGQFDGPMLKYPYSKAVEDVTVTFSGDGNLSIHNIFAKWLDKIINLDEYALAYKKDIVADQEVFQLDSKNISTYGVKLIDAFPTQISPIDLGNTNANTLQTFNVTFIFDRFDILS